MKFANLCYFILSARAVKRWAGVVVFVLLVASASYAQTAATLTLDDYKKFASYKIGNLEEDTYAKLDGGYVLDREAKPFVFNYSDGIERRIYLFRLLKGANREQVGMLALYNTPKNGKQIKVCIPGNKAEKQVWDYYIDELKLHGEKEQGFLSTLAFVLSREYAKASANPGTTSVAKEDDHYDFCFPAGAVVTLADGSSKTIEKVAAGDKLLAFDAATQAQRETTVTGVQAHFREAGFTLTRLLLLPVEEVFASAAAWLPAAPVTLEATANHPVYTKAGRKAIGAVQEGEVLFFFDTAVGGFREYRVVSNVQDSQVAERVYNLETSAGNYLVNGAVVLDK